jgi:hypothetical protein
LALHPTWACRGLVLCSTAVPAAAAAAAAARTVPLCAAIATSKVLL